jgi:hypothetical protein
MHSWRSACNARIDVAVDVLFPDVLLAGRLADSDVPAAVRTTLLDTE